MDGFIAGPDDDMAWLPEFDGDATGFHDFFKDVGAIAMGRRTYEWIDEHSQWPYGDVPAYVLSSSLPEGRAEHVTVTPGPVTDLAATLRDGEGTAWLVGGGGLFAAFAAADLIDLWIVTVIPVMLGDGVPLLPGARRGVPASRARRDAARSPAAACSCTTARSASVRSGGAPLAMPRTSEPSGPRWYTSGASQVAAVGRVATLFGAREAPIEESPDTAEQGAG